MVGSLLACLQDAPNTWGWNYMYKKSSNYVEDALAQIETRATQDALRTHTDQRMRGNTSRRV